MNVADSPRPRHLKAPGSHGKSLVVPALDGVASLIGENTRSQRLSDFDVQGRAYSSLVAQARDDLIRLATRYTRSYRDVKCGQDCAVVQAGHVLPAEYQAFTL